MFLILNGPSPKMYCKVSLQKKPQSTSDFTTVYSITKKGIFKLLISTVLTLLDPQLLVDVSCIFLSSMKTRFVSVSDPYSVESGSGSSQISQSGTGS